LINTQDTICARSVKMSFLLSEVKQKEFENHLKRLHEQEEGNRYMLSFSMIGINVNPFVEKNPFEMYGYLLRDFFQHHGNDIRKVTIWHQSFIRNQRK